MRAGKLDGSAIRLTFQHHCMRYPRLRRGQNDTRWCLHRLANRWAL